MRISTGYSMKVDERSFHKNCTLNFIPLDMTAIQHEYKENINHNLSLTYFFGFFSSSIQLILTTNICCFCFSGQLGDVKLEDLPGPEALLRPGER